MVSIPGVGLARRVPGVELGLRAAALSQDLAMRAAVNVFRATDGGRDILHNSPDGWEVDAPWLWYFEPPPNSGNPPDWSNPPPGAGGGVYGLAALPAVTRCTSIICATLAGLPWQVLRADPDGDVEKLTQPSWIDDPQAKRLDGRVVSEVLDDVRLSAVEFWTQWITAALWLGDGFVYCPVRNSDGQPVPPLWQFHPDLIEVRGGRYFVTGVDEPLPTGSIIHLRGEPPYADGRGCGVLTRHAKQLGLSLTLDSYQSGMYRSGVPAGFLKSSQPHMEDTDAAKLQDAWMKAHGSSRRSIAVLNATTDFTPIQFSPVDAAIDVAKTWGLRDTALAFGIPPYMLGVPGDSSTYANVESRMIELRQFGLLPWARRIESTVDAEFPRGTTMKIKTAGLERADTKSRYEAYTLGINGGWLTVEEVRALEDLALRPPALSQHEQQPALPAGGAQ